jgi:excisionase family DNA binding protein
MSEPLMLTMRQAVERLRPIGRDTVYELARTGRLRTLQVRGRRYVPVSEIEAFIRREAEGGSRG